MTNLLNLRSARGYFFFVVGEWAYVFYISDLSFLLIIRRQLSINIQNGSKVLLLLCIVNRLSSYL